MVHKRIQIPRPTAFLIMNELGKLDDAIEFIDLNKDCLESKKNYSEMIGRCDSMEKKFAKFEKICEDHGIEMIKYESYKKFMKDLIEDETIRGRSRRSTYFDSLENQILEDDLKFEELIESYEKIKESLDYLIEKKNVFIRAADLFPKGQVFRSAVAADDTQRMMEQGFVSDLNYIAGVAKADDELRMKRMIFRVSRGRAIPYFFNIPQEDLKTDKKKVF